MRFVFYKENKYNLYKLYKRLLNSYIKPVLQGLPAKYFYTSYSVMEELKLTVFKAFFHFLHNRDVYCRKLKSSFLYAVSVLCLSCPYSKLHEIIFSTSVHSV